MIINKMIIILIFLLTSCAGGGKYLGYSGINAKNYKLMSHYIYEDDSLALAAGIRSSGILNQFRYELLIINNGNNPINMNWVYDILSLKYKGKTFQLHKMSPISSYPNILNPESFVIIAFTIERRFNNTINDIENLNFQFNDKIFILEKNPNAKWQ